MKGDYASFMYQKKIGSALFIIAGLLAICYAYRAPIKAANVIDDTAHVGSELYVHGEMPIAVLDAPKNDEIRQGTILLQGTMNGTESSFAFSYKKDSASVWTTITQGSVSSTTIVTREFDSTSVPDGMYYIKFTTYTASGNKAEDIALIEVDNQTITYTVD